MSQYSTCAEEIYLLLVHDLMKSMIIRSTIVKRIIIPYFCLPYIKYDTFCTDANICVSHWLFLTSIMMCRRRRHHHNHHLITELKQFRVNPQGTKTDMKSQVLQLHITFSTFGGENTQTCTTICDEPVWLATVSLVALTSLPDKTGCFKGFFKNYNQSTKG